jgi:hypothetical protein
VASKPANPAVSKYEIAKPQSYSAFPLALQPPPAPATAQPVPAEVHERATATRAAAPPTRPAGEEWSDTAKARPQVPPSAKDLFAPPDDFRDKSILADSITREKRAVWIVHGMGQQIPFETLDSLTNGLLDALPGQNIKPRLRTAKIGDQVLQRVEVDTDGQASASAPAKNYELHLYESYWAPKTEGVAKLSDVVSFLWDGGSRGILNFFKKFHRAMFGGMAQFTVPWRTPVWLCLALLILAALTVINGVILLAAAAQSGLFLQTIQLHWDKLTALTSCMLAVAISFGALLFIADISKPQELSKFWRVFIGVCCWTAMVFTILSILKTAALMAIITHTDWLKNYGTNMAVPSTSWLSFIRSKAENLFESIPAPQLQGFATVVILAAGVLVAVAMFARAFLRSSEETFEDYRGLLLLPLLTFAVNVAGVVGCIWIWCHGAAAFHLPRRLGFLQSPLLVWPFLIAFSAKVRELMVQYVGDVAIYVTSNKLDRFDEVRSKIKETARTVASAVFTAYDSAEPKFLYDKIAVVGHSLGSVIAYDTLNRLMLDDWLVGGALQVAERNETLLTFGSPLNKTAFLFTIQGTDSMHIRERLASTVQPLIVSYPKFRKFNWINVYSRNDIISGKLEFYDLPGFQNPKPGDPSVPDAAIKNIIDKDAAVPVVAHVSYWKNKTVWRELLAQIAP